MLPSSDLFLQLCFLNRVVSGLYKPVLSCTVLRLFKFVCSLVLTVSPWRRNSPQRGGLDYPLFQLHTLVTSDQLLSGKADDYPFYQVSTDKNQKGLNHFFILGKSLALSEVFRKFCRLLVMTAICNTTRPIVLWTFWWFILLWDS